jgi:hypothetical protein
MLSQKDSLRNRGDTSKNSIMKGKGIENMLELPTGLPRQEATSAGHVTLQAVELKCRKLVANVN